MTSLNKSSYASDADPLPGTSEAWETAIPQEVLTRLTRRHPNILLVGPVPFIHAALKTVEPLVPQPIVSWSPYESRDVPDGSYATLLIHRVDTADADQQLRLCEWFQTRSRQVQVVSTTLAPIFPAVQSGSFMETLYYRLNHVCLMPGDPGCGF